MKKGKALLVGIKSIDPNSYNGWDGKNGCYGCELDVDNMEDLLKNQNFQIRTLKTKDATYDNILSSLYRAAEITFPGDIFIFYMSSHGGQKKDQIYGGDEVDNKDETFIAYDREITDDKIHRALLMFRKGVKIVMITDCCNSGSNFKSGSFNNEFTPFNKEFINKKMKAGLIHLGGCRDGGKSAGYKDGGVFTKALCEVWKGGSFKGSYKKLYDEICKVIISNREPQKPQYSEYGNVSNQFINERAFSIDSIKSQVNIEVLNENNEIFNDVVSEIVKEEIGTLSTMTNEVINKFNFDKLEEEQITKLIIVNKILSSLLH